MSCDFDREICDGWQQSTSDVFDWKPGTGSTLTSKTGPNGDHTSGSGKRSALLADSGVVSRCTRSKSGKWVRSELSKGLIDPLKNESLRTITKRLCEYWVLIAEQGK